MTIEEVFKYYGNIAEAAKAIDIKFLTFSRWMEKGFIPLHQQKRYEKATNFKLRADFLVADKENFCRQIITLPRFRFYDPKFGMCPLHSISFTVNGLPKIHYYSSYNIRNAKRFNSKFVDHLMRAVPYLDDKGQLLYEKDIILINGRKRTFMSIISDHDLLEEIKTSKFTIIGNIYERKD